MIKTIIKKRKSTRTFNQEYLIPEHKKALEVFIGQIGKGIGGEEINLFILEKGDGEKKMTLDYGVITGHNTYLLGITKDNPVTRLNYGYVMEKLVLKATELGLGTCWIGYFDHDYFNDLNVPEGYKIPGIVVTGYSANTTTLPERFLRFTANAAKRLPWDRLFFNYQTKLPLTPEELKGLAVSASASVSASPSVAASYKESLEMVRLAPSSSNSQPWRIYFDQKTNEFHFFKKSKNIIYERMGMHELDLGIAMAHFELTSESNGLKGSWVFNANDIIPPEEGLKYIISWKCE